MVDFSVTVQVVREWSCVEGSMENTKARKQRDLTPESGGICKRMEEIKQTHGRSWGPTNIGR